jgi:hypothetical protein
VRVPDVRVVALVQGQYLQQCVGDDLHL